MKYFTQSKSGKDTLLFDTRKNGFPVQIPIMKPTFKGGLEDAFSLVRPGDSAVFRISADSLFARTFNQPLPPFIKKGSMLTFQVLAQKVQSQQEAMMDQQKMMMEFMEKQNKKDEQIIQEYVKKEGLKAQKTASGLYYIINQPGNGAPAKAGQTVSVKYKGTLLNGKVFDTSDNPQLGGKPFQFTLGQSQVIRGWDEGIALLNKGAKGTLIVPSTMAYGPQEQRDIPANSVLRFDVELVDVK
ncbi:MAG: FKBP-type peptidyl-prolyl cis-trans isomerase [Bacteroidota bacterium]|nr:FKBP-type peptidyl-prolyl cis-trans isomerase [Bacteroidota bacterium]